MIIVTILGFILIFIGIWGVIVRRNLIKMILAFSIMDTGVNLIIVSVGYIQGKTAPIIDAAIQRSEAVSNVVDPIPSALVLTAIVIGLAVTALMLSYAIKMYEKKGTLSIDKFKELKW